MYEHHKEPVLPRQQFLRRAARHGGVSTLTSDAAKLFASCYALYSGIVFVTATGVLLAPFLHRVLRRMRVTDQALVENL